MSPFCLLAPATEGKRWPLIGRNEPLRNPAYNQTLEVENDAGGDAQVVLILRAVAEFVEMREQIVHLDGTERQTMRDVDVQAAAESHGERIVRGRES